IEMWLLRFKIRVPRPFARARNRLYVGAASTVMVSTFSSSTSALKLFSAFAIADSSTLRTIRAPFFGVKRSTFNACPTGLPRTMSATRRHFCGEIRAYFSLAATRMIRPLCLLVARVRLERTCGRELTELVPHHVLGDQHRHVLTTVVHCDRQSDHLRNDHGPTRPSLDRAAIVLLHRQTDFLRKMRIDERSFLNRTRHCLLPLGCSSRTSVAQSKRRTVAADANPSLISCDDERSCASCACCDASSCPWCSNPTG